MCGGFSHHFSAYILTAGEKDIVKITVQQTGVFPATAGHHGNQLFRKTAFQKPGKQGGGGGGVSAGLDDDGISGGKSVGNGDN